MPKPIQQKLFLSHPKPKNKNTSTFINNLKLPIHRWLRFSAGFSAQWVQNIILKEIEKKGPDICLLDPFAGSGTSLLSADECKISSYGIEAQPFIAKIARIKTRWDCDINIFNKKVAEVAEAAKHHTDLKDDYPKLIYKCYPKDVLLKLEGLKKAWQDINDLTIESELIWLCITCILRPVSKAGTAQWQYVLPKKSKKKVMEVFEGFDLQAKAMAKDVSLFQRFIGHPRSNIILGSSMDTQEIPINSVDLLITSPPYANNYDYADATRLEQSFWGEITGWADLHDKTRKNLIRSCSQHAAKVKQTLDEILSDPDLEPILPEITKVTKTLEIEREKYGGKKHYHLMIAGYFSDMAKVWKNLRRMCREESTICFVVGDSAPYSVYTPVDKWIGELAVASGFRSYKFEKIRDRNIKWKNRKHKVPLHEGNLWIEG